MENDLSWEEFQRVELRDKRQRQQYEENTADDLEFAAERGYTAIFGGFAVTAVRFAGHGRNNGVIAATMQ